MTARNAFDTAQKVLKSAGTRLAGNIDGTMAGLLNDAFGITPNTAVSAVGTIRSALTKIANYFQNGTFIYIWNPPANARGFAAYAQTQPRRPEVFLTDSFFTSNTRRERAGLLVHEYVHLHHYAAGHPGTQGELLRVSFGRSSLGIPPNHSVNNAYCYQYFVEWFAADYHIP
ncbi:MAG: M35 family metallo-endopeptidase [Pseudomonadota bacterium]